MSLANSCFLMIDYHYMDIFPSGENVFYFLFLIFNFKLQIRYFFVTYVCETDILINLLRDMCFWHVALVADGTVGHVEFVSNIVKQVVRVHKLQLI